MKILVSRGGLKKSGSLIPASVEKVRTFSIKMLEGEHLSKDVPLNPDKNYKMIWRYAFQNFKGIVNSPD